MRVASSNLVVNLVMYRTDTWAAQWWTGAFATDAYTTMQFDGDLVTYNQGGGAIWNTGTWQFQGAGVFLAMQDDANLVLYKADGQPIWSRYSGPIGPPPPVLPPPTIDGPGPVFSVPSTTTSPMVWVGLDLYLGNYQSQNCIFPLGALQDGTALVGGNCSASTDQAWVVTQSGSFFRLHPLNNQNLCLDIDAYNGQNGTMVAENGARAQVWTCTGGSNQSFAIVYQSSTGAFQLQPQTSGGGGAVKCLDQDTNPVNLVIQQWNCLGTANQSWSPIPSGDVPAATLSDVTVVDGNVNSAILPGVGAGTVPASWTAGFRSGVGALYFARNVVQAGRPRVALAGCTASVVSGTSGRTLVTAKHCFTEIGRRKGDFFAFVPEKNVNNPLTSGRIEVLSYRANPDSRPNANDMVLARLASSSGGGSLPVAATGNGAVTEAFGYPRAAANPWVMKRCQGTVNLSATLVFGNINACGGDLGLRRTSGGPMVQGGALVGVITNGDGNGLYGGMLDAAGVAWVESVKNSW